MYWLTQTFNQQTSNRISWNQIKLALANLGINKSSYWPQLNATYNYTSNKDSSQQSSLSYNNQTQITYGPSIALNYLLWDFGVRSEKVKSADFQLQAAKLTRNATFQQVILQVEQAYYQLIWQQALVEAVKDSVKENKTNLDTAKKLRSQGMATIGDVYQAESYLYQAELALEQAIGSLKITEGQLANAIGLSVDTPINIMSLKAPIKTKPILKTMKELLKVAKESRPDLLAIEAQINAASAQLVATTRQDWPTIELNTNNQRTYTKNPLLNKRSHSVNLAVNIPLFSGFSQRSLIAQAEAQQDQAKVQKDNLAQQIDLQVWQYYFALQTAAKNIDSSQKLLTSSQQAANQSSGKYKAGTGNILDVLTTQATLSSARSQLIQAKLNWYTGIAQLTGALGKINVPDQFND